MLVPGGPGGPGGPVAPTSPPNHTNRAIIDFFILNVSVSTPGAIVHVDVTRESISSASMLKSGTRKTSAGLVAIS